MNRDVEEREQIIGDGSGFGKCCYFGNGGNEAARGERETSVTREREKFESRPIISVSGRNRATRYMEDLAAVRFARPLDATAEKGLFERKFVKQTQQKTFEMDVKHFHQEMGDAVSNRTGSTYYLREAWHALIFEETRVLEINTRRRKEKGQRKAIDGLVSNI